MEIGLDALLNKGFRAVQWLDGNQRQMLVNKKPALRRAIVLQVNRLPFQLPMMIYGLSGCLVPGITA